MKLLLDTNFLIDCIRFRIDFFNALSQLEDFEGHVDVFIPSICVSELKKIKKKEARLALSFAERTEVLRVDESIGADSTLIECGKKGYSVATNDIKLIRKLKDNEIRVVRIKDRRYFDFA